MITYLYVAYDPKTELSKIGISSKPLQAPARLGVKKRFTGISWTNNTTENGSNSHPRIGSGSGKETCSYSSPRTVVGFSSVVSVTLRGSPTDGERKEFLMLS